MGQQGQDIHAGQSDVSICERVSLFFCTMFRNTVEEQEKEEQEEEEQEEEDQEEEEQEEEEQEVEEQGVEEEEEEKAEEKLKHIHRAVKRRVTYYTLNLLVAFSKKNYLLIKVVILQVM